MRNGFQGLLYGRLAFLTWCLSFPVYSGQGLTEGDTALPQKALPVSGQDPRPQFPLHRDP